MEVVDAPQAYGKRTRRGSMKWRVGMLVLWVAWDFGYNSPDSPDYLPRRTPRHI